MRKIIVWLIFSLVAVLAFASCGEGKNRTAELFDQESEKNGYYLDLETTSEGEDLRLKIHIKGEYFYIETIINGSVVELIKNKDGYFILQPESRIGYKINEEMFDDTVDIDHLSSMNRLLKGQKITRGKAKVDGVEYEFEEFREDDVIIKFMYDKEDKLRYIIAESEDDEDEPEKMKINAFKKKADESKFTIPENYKVEEWHEVDDWYRDGDDSQENFDDLYDDYDDFDVTYD
ncbi:MAG: hypothetical protein ACOYJU_00410 [Anaerovoracaceae bacterium]|jgi:hypothetical protein